MQAKRSDISPFAPQQPSTTKVCALAGLSVAAKLAPLITVSSYRVSVWVMVRSAESRLSWRVKVYG